MDLKTLRLASLQLSPERLDAFVTYERTLLDALSKADAPDWNGKYAFAHARALAASKLDLVEMGKLKSLVGDFCGRRSNVEMIKARIAAGAETPKQEAALLRAKRELPRLDDLKPFEDRYGAEAVGLLVARERELLELHRALAKAEGAGHIHPA